MSGMGYERPERDGHRAKRILAQSSERSGALREVVVEGQDKP